MSLLWWANEKECKDSVGNRARSSLKGNVGDEGPVKRASELWRDTECDSGIGGKDGRLWRLGDDGFRDCRMRRRPESRSAVKMGDLR